jgi:hypothetical protein
METGRPPKLRHLVAFVLLHVVIVAACGVAIWQMVGGVVSPGIERIAADVTPRLPMVAGLLVVLAILAASGRRS